MEFGHKTCALKPSPKRLTILFTSRFTAFGSFLDAMDEKSCDHDHSTEVKFLDHLVRKSNPHHTVTWSGRATSLRSPRDSVRVGNKAEIYRPTPGTLKELEVDRGAFRSRRRLWFHPTQTPLPGEVSACYSKIIIYYRPTTPTTERF